MLADGLPSAGCGADTRGAGGIVVGVVGGATVYQCRRRRLAEARWSAGVATRSVGSVVDGGTVVEGAAQAGVVTRTGCAPFCTAESKGSPESRDSPTELTNNLRRVQCLQLPSDWPMDRSYVWIRASLKVSSSERQRLESPGESLTNIGSRANQHDINWKRTAACAPSPKRYSRFWHMNLPI